MLKLLARIVSPRPAAVDRPPRRRNPDAVVDCAIYRAGLRKPGAVHFAQAKRHRGEFLWLGLHEPDLATMRTVAGVFGLHELLVEQAVEGGHRPAVETNGDVTRLVLRTARYVEHAELTATSEVIDTGDVTLLIGSWFAITVRHGAAGALWPVRQEIEKRPDLLRAGPWAVAYAVANRLVDAYLDVSMQVEHDLERLEEETFATRHSADIAHFYQLKREMVELKRAVLPLQEPLARLLDLTVVPDGLRPYLVDVRGRLARAVDRVAGFDDLLNSILQARLTQVTLEQNNDMRMIAAWAAIAAVPTVGAGIYGMNFTNMPGIDSRYGFSVTIVIVVLVCSGLFWRFKRAGWL
ncbi:magnesium and cobalt transport protein CorA [Paractinoplanes lichenicola]|uniref:Magnesium and cobalt transport protein CorA n=1 Tax=Paractinoplanes lichenicola TaxID=2802976 RepID=A0ABS1W129_9ACTN|nr:magnesium and cobalt transport protein CorA [Actinoplanes lichenicola]MBL7260444.1 magnesium and cobalt transport protein CorA [Actinoplanes lichenicola]